ncbi:diguanylate cyclase (GGDEF)-like protein [Paenibacillus forsythiae]|uniref:Diguanylate cyclase (GGDEF)-like protein n=1 Tax=Paenibacillus forsythiae TaxID=365616 RepID=A0ABU3HBE4_9BACL|nr:GGDEF domain-containing protein [Paenibacillus forsythiae]MDT3428134.1 diguanylate cyclase (GGDEF)-like protein [Paenibacillus forsythiae]
MRIKDFLNASDASIHRQTKWIKRFLETYWVVIALHLAAQLFSYFFLPYEIEAGAFYYKVLAGPTLLMGGTVAAAQLVDRYAARYSFISMFTAGTFVSMVIIHLNMDVRIIGAVMLLPIMASAIFFRLDLTMYTAALQIAAFCILYNWDYRFKAFLNPFDLVSIPLFILVGTLVAGIIIVNGRELLHDLETTMTAKQDLMAENALILKISRTDALTGLFNHMSFHEFYEKALEYGELGVPFHLALLDIDNFKGVNDKFGHRAGDLVLSRVAYTIQENIPSTDIAARYGGEEFAVLLFEPTFEEALGLMERVRTAFSETRHAELGGLAVTVSIGLKSFEKGMTKERLFEDTDALLYAAKRAGRNKVITPLQKVDEGSVAL